MEISIEKFEKLFESLFEQKFPGLFELPNDFE